MPALFVPRRVQDLAGTFFFPLAVQQTDGATSQDPVVPPFDSPLKPFHMGPGFNSQIEFQPIKVPSIRPRTMFLKWRAMVNTGLLGDIRVQAVAELFAPPSTGITILFDQQTLTPSFLPSPFGVLEVVASLDLSAFFASPELPEFSIYSTISRLGAGPPDTYGDDVNFTHAWLELFVG